MRLVCSNGLRVPVDAEGSRHRHVQSLSLDDIDAALTAHLAAASADSERWAKWIGIGADQRALHRWADSVLAPAWGVVNAARVLHILRTGFDARRRAARPGIPATLLRMEPTHEVPGSAPPNDNLFRVAQALAWVAKSPTDMSHRFERELQIDRLVGELAAGVGTAA